MIQKYLDQCIEVQLAIPFVVISILLMIGILIQTAVISYRESQAAKKGIKYNEMPIAKFMNKIGLAMLFLLFALTSMAIIFRKTKQPTEEPQLSPKYSNEELMVILKTKLQPLSDSADYHADRRDSFMRSYSYNKTYVDSAIFENNRLIYFEAKLDSINRVYGMDSVYKNVDRLKETNPELF